MRIFTHGIKSLIRRPAKTTMLFFILFIVFNLIFTGFIIESSISESKSYIREEIGSAVEYKMDYTSLIQNTGGNVRGGRVDLPVLSLQVANKIATSKYVSDYFVSESGNVNSDTLTPVESQSSAGGFQFSSSDFTLAGSNQIEDLDFAMGNVKLTEGSVLSNAQMDQSDPVVIISKDLASTNNLRLGDSISLSQASARAFGPQGQSNQNTNTSSDAVALDYEIIGVYEAIDTEFDVNKIFTSNNAIYAMKGTTQTDDTNASIVYLLDSPEHVDAFISESTPYLTSEYHILYSNDDEYQTLTKPLNLLSFITSILIWVVFVAGAAIILAVVTIFVRDRKFEIGLLLSSGESRLKIISQFIFEMLVIAIVAFVISIGSSSLVSQGVSTWIVDSQLLSQTSIINDSASTNINQMITRGTNQNTASLYGDVNMEKVANEFNVSIGLSTIIQLLLSSIGLVLIGSAVPLTVIMSYNPRRILQDY